MPVSNQLTSDPTTPSLAVMVRRLKESNLLAERDAEGWGPLFAVPARRDQQGFLLSAFARYLEEGGEVYCLDAGNCFDPYPLALATRARGSAPEAFMERVFVSRAATCHQIVSVVEEMLLPLCEAPEGKAVLVLGIDTLFVDEDIQLFERRYLFKRTLEGIERLREAGLGTLATYNPKHLADRETRVWGEMVRRLRRTPSQIPSRKTDRFPATPMTALAAPG